MDILFVSHWTFGDIAPILKIAKEFKKRNIEVKFCTHSIFKELVESNGVIFIPLDTIEEYENTRKSFKKLVNDRVSISDYEDFFYSYYTKENSLKEFEIYKKNCNKDTIIIGRHGSSFIAKLYAQIFKKKFISIILSPNYIYQTELEAASFKINPVSLLSEISNEVSDSHIEFGTWTDWMFANEQNICLWPYWFFGRELQTKYRINLFNSVHIQNLKNPLLSSNSYKKEIKDKILVTDSTNNAVHDSYISSIIGAIENSDHKALICSNRHINEYNHIDSIEFIKPFVFDNSLSSTKLLIHHGGIGTTLEAIRLGIPQLILPFGLDRPFNAQIATKIGVAKSVDHGNWNKQRINKEINEILSNDEIKNNCKEYSRKILEDKTSRIVDYVLTNLQAVKEDSYPYISVNDEFELPSSSMSSLFKRTFKNNRNRVAYIFKGKEYTIHEVDKITQKISNFMTCELGSEKRLVIYMSRTINAVFTMIASMRSGIPFIPIDIELPTKRIKYILMKTGATVILTDKLNLQFESESELKVYNYDSFDNYSNQIEIGSNIIEEDTPLYYLFTSGSTGEPKGVEVTHKNLANFLYSMSQEPGMSENSKLLSLTRFTFDISMLELYLPLLCESTCILTDSKERVDIEKIKEMIVSYGINYLQATPSFWNILLRSGWIGNKNLVALSGGEAISKDLASDLCKRVKTLWNMYGPTETTVWSTLWKVDRLSSTIQIGKPIGNTSLMILDKNGAIMSKGNVGEICIGGFGVANGYVNDLEKTRQNFVNVLGYNGIYYKTGDLGKFDSDGVLECFGRVDSQVKINGYRIELNEIAKQLNRITEISDCVVSTISRDNDRKYIAAYYVSSKSIEEKYLRKSLQEFLPNYMIPTVFVKIQKIPINENGKIDYKSLSNIKVEQNEMLFETELIDEKAYIKYLLDLWPLIIDNTSPIDEDSHFFHSGGDSLAVLRLANEIESKVGIEIGLHFIYENPSLKDQASVLYQLKFGINTETEKNDDSYDISSNVVKLSNINQVSCKLQNYFSNYSQIVKGTRLVRKYKYANDFLYKRFEEYNLYPDKRRFISFSIRLTDEIATSTVEKRLLDLINEQSVLRSHWSINNANIEITEYDSLTNINFLCLKFNDIYENIIKQIDIISRDILNKEFYNRIPYLLFFLEDNQSKYLYLCINHLIADMDTKYIIQRKVHNGIPSIFRRNFFEYFNDTFDNNITARINKFKFSTTFLKYKKAVKDFNDLFGESNKDNPLIISEPYIYKTRLHTNKFSALTEGLYIVLHGLFNIFKIDSLPIRIFVNTRVSNGNTYGGVIGDFVNSILFVFNRNEIDRDSIEAKYRNISQESKENNYHLHAMSLDNEINEYALYKSPIAINYRDFMNHEDESEYIDSIKQVQHIPFPVDIHRNSNNEMVIVYSNGFKNVKTLEKVGNQTK